MKNSERRTETVVIAVTTDSRVLLELLDLPTDYVEFNNSDIINNIMVCSHDFIKSHYDSVMLKINMYTYLGKCKYVNISPVKNSAGISLSITAKTAFILIQDFVQQDRNQWKFRERNCDNNEETSDEGRRVN